MRSLLSAGATVNARDEESSTPLHYACVRGHVDAVRLLVAAGADVAAIDVRRRSPADVIGTMGYVKVDVSNAIKTVFNRASEGLRAQAVSLKQVGIAAMSCPHTTGPHTTGWGVKRVEKV